MNIGAIQNTTYTTAYQSVNRNKSDVPDFETIMKQRLEQMEKDVESGKIDADTLKQKLEERFGSTVDDAFSTDGSIDFDKLQEILESQAGQAAQGMPSGPPPGPPPEGMSGMYSDGSTSNGSSSSFSLDTSQLQSKLIDLFGESAEGIVGEDGTVDFDKLKEVVEEYQTQLQNQNQYQNPMFSGFSPYYDSSTSHLSSLSSPVFLNMRM